MSPEEIEAEKRKLLFALYRFQMKNNVQLPRELSMASSLDEIQLAVEFCRREAKLTQAVTLSKRVLVTVCSGLEFLNDRYDPFDIYLKGWSETVKENEDEYDDVFEELYEKYQDKVAVTPEIKLMMMLVGSAAGYHLMYKGTAALAPKKQMPLAPVAPVAPVSQVKLPTQPQFASGRASFQPSGAPNGPQAGPQAPQAPQDRTDRPNGPDRSIAAPLSMDQLFGKGPMFMGNPNLNASNFESPSPDVPSRQMSRQSLHSPHDAPSVSLHSTPASSPVRGTVRGRGRGRGSRKKVVVEV